MENKQKIIATAIEIIETQGADSLTVRNICAKSKLSNGTFYHYFKNKDDLLMNFVRDIAFDEFELKTPLEKISDRIAELYMHLLNRYMQLGKNFMRNFYSTNNQALSAYMGTGTFAPGTVMFRSERELELALKNGILKSEIDTHIVAADICTIIKGCVFEWCLNDSMNFEETIRRILKIYFESIFE